MGATFIETLKAETAKFQAAHPAREGEIARAHALIAMGMVVDHGDGNASVLSSDGTTSYRVNGSCSCEAGAHGKACKHLHAVRLYRHVQQTMAAQDIVVDNNISPCPLPEAPASCNVRIQMQGCEVQLTLRDTDETRLLARLEAVLAQYPLEAPRSPQAPTAPETRYCSLHGTAMRQTTKDGRSWFSHKTAEGWCKGK